MADYSPEDLFDIRRFAGYGQPLEGVELTGNAALLEASLVSHTAETAEAIIANFVEPIRDQYTALRKAKLHLLQLDDIKYSSDEVQNRFAVINALGGTLAGQLNVPAGPYLSGSGGPKAKASMVTR